MASLSRRALLRARRPQDDRIWIADACLARRGIVCRTCGDACPVGAIRFRPVLGGAPSPSVDLDACTACGECAPPCPVSAIEVARAA